MPDHAGGPYFPLVRIRLASIEDLARIADILPMPALPVWTGGLGRLTQVRLVELGFAPDWFLPLHLAEQWQSPFYPAVSAVDAVTQWRVLMEALAGEFRNYDRDALVELFRSMRPEGLGDEKLAAIQHRDEGNALLLALAGRLQSTHPERIDEIVSTVRQEGAKKWLVMLANDWELLRIYDARLVMDRQVSDPAASLAIPPEKPLLPITSDDETVLIELHKTVPTAIQQAYIEQTTRIAHKKLSSRIDYLLTNGLVTKPFGDRTGLVITDYGKRHVAKHFSADGTLKTP